MRTAFRTYGCRLNKAEALEEEARFRAEGDEIVCLEDSPERIVVRACSVTAKAERDCRHDIANLRARFPNCEMVVRGCLPGIGRESGDPFGDDPFVVPMATARAYLKVQDGCGGACAFCIVPQFRGRSVSLAFGRVMDRVKAFLDAGYREIVVTGCNLALYRDGGVRFPQLLEAIANVDGYDYRVRIGSYEPGICDDELIGAFARNENICKFLHLSIQSASERILRFMKRPYSFERLDGLCGKLRNEFGDKMLLGCDVISGFPGETEDDFMRTRSFLAKHRFANIHSFPYSERPGTVAAEMGEVVPRAVRLERAHLLGELGMEIKRNFAQGMVGRRVRIVIEKNGNEGHVDEYLTARLTEGRASRRSVVRGIVTGVSASDPCSLLVS